MWPLYVQWIYPRTVACVSNGVAGVSLPGSQGKYSTSVLNLEWLTQTTFNTEIQKHALLSIL